MIHLSLADVGEQEIEAVVRAMRSGWVAPLGPEVDAFEAEMAQRVGVAGAVALSSGTAALHLALLEVGVGPGTMVLCPTMTFAATANAITYTGAEPVFVDVCEQDANVDVDLLLQTADDLIAADQRVAAVVTVDLYGSCADNTRLEAELGQRGIPLIEDAAEAVGASRDGRSAGSFGVAAALSFNGNKLMTTSGGGMLLSNDEHLLARCRYLATQARQPVPWYEHTEIGFNYRMSNILAAIGRVQLSRVDEFITRRRAIRQTYRQAFADLDVAVLTDRDGQPTDATANCWLTTLTLGPSAPDADHLVAELNAQQIEARHVWKPMHLQPVFASARRALTGASERLYRRGINLPSGSSLSDDEVSVVVAATRRAIDAGRPEED